MVDLAGNMNRNARNWDHCLDQAALSDVGLRRSNNQDSKAVVLAGSPDTWRERGHVFMVADGMGAHAAGELASKLATDTVPLTYQKLRELAPPDALREAVLDANRLIHTRGEANADFRGMGTTASVLALLPQGALVAHVGDSRAYRLRRGRLEQLTFDHSLVWEIRAAEKLSGGEVPDYIPKNVITRSLGPNPTVRVDIEGPFPVDVGDVYLLCSDGLSGQVSDEEIGKILGSMPPEEAVRSLVDLANLRGGPDNITVVVVQVTGPELTRAGAEELARAHSGGPKNLASWGILALLAAAALGLAAAAAAIGAFWLGMAAVACGIGAVVTGVSAAIRSGEQPRTNHTFDTRPLGRGPYAACDCTADAAFVDQLAGIIEQLRQVSEQEHWSIDGGPLTSRLDQARAAAGAGDCRSAVREYCLAIDYMMGQLKTRRGGR
jgi:protein phosphatase